MHIRPFWQQEQYPLSKSHNSEVHSVGAAAGGEVAERGGHVVHLELILQPSNNNQELPHLDQRVDAGDGARGAGQQLPGGEAAVAVAQVRDRAHLTEGRVVRQLSGA